MKRFTSLLIVLLLFLVIIFALSSCNNSNSTTSNIHECQHQWIEADCLYPKTCRLCNKTEGNALNHSWNEATCTTPKTCRFCNVTEGIALGHTEVVDAAVEPTCTKTGLTEGKHCSVCNEVIIPQAIVPTLEHDWGNPTCTTPRSCCVCFTVDPNSEPFGHAYMQGVCMTCGDDDPNYIAPTLTSTTYNINLENDSSIAHITMIGGETIVYDIDDTSVVLCEWGDWDGNTIPLTFYPISSGSTFVTVYIEDYDKSITINVTVTTPADLTTLTIEGIGKELQQHTNTLPNTNKLHSATYRISDYPNDTICIFVDFVVSCIDCVNYTGYIRLRYNLYNSCGVVVETGTTITEFTHTHTQYAGTLSFSDLPPDDYKLVFSDKY